MCDQTHQSLDDLLANNRQWVAKTLEEDPGYFGRLETHNPHYLWIGCSDARVPANTIVGMDSGKIFVHRNIGNQVHSADMNVVAVIQYAVEVLKVEHIIVTGHYDCGAVKASMQDLESDILQQWLRPIRKLYHTHKPSWGELTRQQMGDELTRLNVQTQVTNLCNMAAIRNAWRRGQKLSIHGWVYSLHTGIIEDQQIRIHNLAQANQRLKTLNAEP